MRDWGEPPLGGGGGSEFGSDPNIGARETTRTRVYIGTDAVLEVITSIVFEPSSTIK